jgi:hypothetical protein
MALRAEELVDTTCYSELHSLAGSLGNHIIYTLPVRSHLPSHSSVYMTSNNPQRSQPRFRTPETPSRQRPQATPQLPFYLPPAQPLPIFSSTFSDNQEIPEPTSNNAPGYQGYRGYLNPVQGIVPPPFQYQPQLGYPPYQPQTGYLPYQPQPEYNVTSFPSPYISVQPTAPLPPFRHPSHPANIPRPQPYLANTGTKIPIVQQEKPLNHDDSSNGTHEHQSQSLTQVEPTPASTNAYHSTPVLQRMSSGRVHDDERRMFVKDLVPLLKQELASNTSQSAALANAIFPTDRLPFPVDDHLLHHLAVHKIWSMEGAHFIQKPESFTEEGLANWLNILGRTIGMASNKKRVRIWSARSHNLPPSGSSTIRKPDLILLDRDDYSRSCDEKVHWSSIRAFGEVTAQESFPPRMTDTVNDKSFVLFLTQDNRRFVPALKFDGSGNFSLTITDRQGQIRMPALSLFMSGKDCALLLLRILAALMYGSLFDVGVDPSMVCDKEGNVTTIFVNEKEFKVYRRIYALQALVGRGTKVWIVTRGEQFYILKDSWVQSGRLESEIDFLKLMVLDPILTGRVPKLIEGEDLQFGNYADSTEWYRTNIGQVDRHRVHRRHVTEPIGSPLIKFKSRVEFLSAIVDVVKGMFFLKKKPFTNNMLTAW